MATSTEDIAQVVSFCARYVLKLRHSVIEAAADSFSAATSCKVHAKGPLTFLFKAVCFREASVNFRFASVEGHYPHLPSLFILQELVVPNVVVAIAFFVCAFLLGLIGLLASWPLHPFVDFQVLELPVELDFFFMQIYFFLIGVFF
jgi:hypothetical protein